MVIGLALPLKPQPAKRLRGPSPGLSFTRTRKVSGSPSAAPSQLLSYATNTRPAA